MRFTTGMVFFVSVLLVGCASYKPSGSDKTASDQELGGVRIPKQWARADTTPEQLRQDRARCGLQAYKEETATGLALVFNLCMQAKGYRPVYKDQTAEPPAADAPTPTAESAGGAAVDCTMLVRLWRSFLVDRAQGITAEEQIANFPPELRAYAGELIRAAYQVDPAIVTNPERRGYYLAQVYDRCVARDWEEAR